MNDIIVYSCDYISITRKHDGFYIESFKKGMTLDSFNQVMGKHPEIKIISFLAVKDALLFAPCPPKKFAVAKDRISIEVSDDELKAYITLSVLEDELKGDKKVLLIKDIIKALNEKDIVFGIKHDVLLDNLCSNRQILVAEGTPPESGRDSEIKMYELREVQPEVREDGTVDHYELNLINRVCAGEWLGEKKDSTPGTPGKSVKGKVIPPVPGKSYPLSYDRKSVKESYSDGVTTLHAIKNGAVHYEGDRISVSDFLEIVGNVDFKTGNVDFDGYLTVKGSVEDNFSVYADKDIEILGDYGVGSVKEIYSRAGSIYIKGGIAGKSRAVIRSHKNIYTKYVSDATIICEGDVHIGFYCLNSSITAKQVILDSPRGQIIGGSINAEIRVLSSIIGSASEKRTFISVKGFNRSTLRASLEEVLQSIERLKSELMTIKQEIAIYSYASNLSPQQKNDFEDVRDKYYSLRDDLKALEDSKKALVNYLRAHGEGEVSIAKKAYPNTVLEIKKTLKEIDKIIMATTFYIQDGDIKEI